MYSHRFIRDNLDLLKRRLKLRGVEESFVEEVHREIVRLNGLKEEEQRLNERRNGLIAQGARENAEAIRAIKGQQATIRADIGTLESRVSALVDQLPNIPDESLTAESKLMGSWGTTGEIPGLIPHRELCKRLDLLSFDEAIAISGSGFAVYKNQGAALFRSLIDFTLKCNLRAGYQERFLPVLLLPHSLHGTAQLPKFEEDLYRTTDGLYLSPTSESQLVNLHRERILESSRLPLKLTANTPCFRKEAGAHGAEDAGIIRLHQFSKTEIVVICPEEDSFRMMEQMVKDACSILEQLEIPHRVIQLAYDDMGFSASKTYDIEAWFPSESRYREISSVSNTLDFQARRAKIRHKRNPLDKNEKARFPHLLNGSALAIDRLFAAVVDNHQQRDGSLRIPRALVPHLGFESIGP